MKEVHILNREEFEETAVQLYSLLKVLSVVDPDNETALFEMPNALKAAVKLADDILCTVNESK